MMDTTADSKMIGTLNFSISFMLYPPSLYAISELGDASGVLKEPDRMHRWAQDDRARTDIVLHTGHDGNRCKNVDQRGIVHELRQNHAENEHDRNNQDHIVQSKDTGKTTGQEIARAAVRHGSRDGKHEAHHEDQRPIDCLIHFSLI